VIALVLLEFGLDPIGITASLIDGYLQLDVFSDPGGVALGIESLDCHGVVPINFLVLGE